MFQVITLKPLVGGQHANGERVQRLKGVSTRFPTAMEIFKESKHFPREGTYSLIDQIRRSSRSVPANIGEGYRKKLYPKMFISKMADADGEQLKLRYGWIWLLPVSTYRKSADSN
jgi:four helix bundle protein